MFVVGDLLTVVWSPAELLGQSLQGNCTLRNFLWLVLICSLITFAFFFVLPLCRKAFSTLSWPPPRKEPLLPWKVSVIRGEWRTDKSSRLILLNVIHWIWPVKLQITCLLDIFFYFCLTECYKERLEKEGILAEMMPGALKQMNRFILEKMSDIERMAKRFASWLITWSHFRSERWICRKVILPVRAVSTVLNALQYSIIFNCPQKLSAITFPVFRHQLLGNWQHFCH